MFFLGAPWPEGILETPYPKGLHDKGRKVLFHGLVVWMLIHWAAPIVSMSNDYLDPMVQRAARSHLESGKGPNCNDPRILG